MKNNHLLLNLTLTLLLTACSSLQQPKSNSVAKAFNNPTRPAKSIPAATPDAIAAALVPDFNQTLAPSAYSAPQGLLNVSVHEVEARDFFMGLVVDSNENMMVNPDVSGRISLELKNVTIAQVMEAAQKVYGYDYKKTDIGYIVYPATLQTKTFKINRLDLLREGRSNTLVTSGQIGNSSNGGNNNSQNNQNQQNQNNQQNGNQPGNNQSVSYSSGTLLSTTTITDFWKELDTSLHSIIAVDKDATVVINKQSGVIVARAKPMQLREIDNFLNTTQNQIGRQVILEAKILEVILDDGHQAGVNWENIVREGIKNAPMITGVGAIGALNSQVFTIGGKAGDFRAFVELLETQGKTNILSSPRISTLNNQKAIIKVGKDEYFITNVASNTIASNNNPTISQNITFTPFFSGIALDVTPQIDDEQNITLHIHPSITRVESQDKKFTINGEAGSVPMALNTVRESDSIVKSENGQIIVLGGLMQESIKEDKEGVAGLTQIPFIGNLFRVNKGNSQKSELIILLKTSIINGDADWQNAIQPTQQNFEHLDAQPRWR
ncbi:MAG: pilus (MSHA type) biogenesis protein MshL [Methylococcales bacterium]